jgi:hypothetical protein
MRNNTALLYLLRSAAVDAQYVLMSVLDTERGVSTFSHLIFESYLIYWSVVALLAEM